MARFGRYGTPLAAALLLTACAGGFSPDRSVTQISTDPPAARCTLEGKGFNQVIQTPAYVVLPKEAAPVTVSCASSGYRTFATSLKPRFNGDVMGNLLLGSALGLVVDFVNGHNLKYPRHVHLNMEPAAFPDVAARDRWFDRYRTHIVEKWSGVVGGIGNGCSGQDAESSRCKAQLQAAQEARARELGLLEQRRREAPVRQADGAQQPSQSLE